MEQLENSQVPENAVPTRFEKRKIIIERLSRELKELFGPNVFVINMRGPGAISARAKMAQGVDIVVQTSPTDADDVRRFLERENPVSCEGG